MTSLPEKPGALIVLGGGIAGLTAAYYASEPGHREVFPGGIHVYEMSDRLGGKGASGRATTRNIAQRIEEHGLHVWFGFYDNAFALLAKCHAYLEDEARGGYRRWASSLRDVEDGFRPCSRVGVLDYDGANWLPWVADFPTDARLPWDPREDSHPFCAPLGLVVRALRLAEALLYSLVGRTGNMGRPPPSLLDPSLIPFPIHVSEPLWLSGTLERFFTTPAASSGNLELLSGALRLLSRIASEARNRVDETVRSHSEVRRGWYVIDLLIAAARGLIDDGVVSTGNFGLIDHHELRAWLAIHGASEETVSSGLLKALVYDLAFAYAEGDPGKPACSAATGVYGLLRLLLTYRGAIMWKMNAGMGEIVFAPIYEALRHRGVEFHFGHKLKDIALVKGDDGRTRAQTLTFCESRVSTALEELPTLEIQSGPLAGKLPYWPNLGPVAAHTPTQRPIGKHDMLVYALPVGTISDVMPAAPGAWRDCSMKVKTVATAALQLWLGAPLSSYAAWAAPDITMGAYTEPFDTWSDMKTLIGEQRTEAAGPGALSVAYFTNVAPDGLTDPIVQAKAEAFIKHGLTDLWPSFDPGIELDRYVRWNDDASSRYSLSLPGTLTARLLPSDRSIRNVLPAGDWTRNSISAGCIEAAVISGMLASRVLRPDLPLPIYGEQNDG